MLEKDELKIEVYQVLTELMIEKPNDMDLGKAVRRILTEAEEKLKGLE